MKSGAGLIKTSLVPLPALQDMSVSSCHCLSPQIPPPFILCQPSNRLRHLPLRQHPRPTFPMTPRQSQILIPWPSLLYPLECLGRRPHLSRIQKAQSRLLTSQAGLDYHAVQWLSSSGHTSRGADVPLLPKHSGQRDRGTEGHRGRVQCRPCGRGSSA